MLKFTCSSFIFAVVEDFQKTVKDGWLITIHALDITKKHVMITPVNSVLHFLCKVALVIELYACNHMHEAISHSTRPILI